MTRLNVKSWFLLISLCLFSASVFAEGNLYVFVFKNSAAQKDITIEVGSVRKTTNEFGLANFSLDAGQYEIGYYKNGELFALTEFNLLKDQQSQIFLTLTKEGEKVELDLPLAAYDQNFEQSEIKQQTGPKGTLKLKVLNSKTNRAVVGAKLYFKGYAVEAQTDAKGIATVELSEEKYDISVIHPKFVMKVMKDIAITAEKTTELEAKLAQADIVLDEFVVTAPAVEGSLASTFTAMKESDVIGDAISSDEFTKAGDSSAADALKRVTGITIVDDKYVYVRGLGERYSVVLLNDLYIPSPEPTKRVVPLDIFPSSVIQSMNIQKTYSPDLPGTFAGGDVLINSKDIPEEDDYIKLSLSTTYNSSTGKKAFSNSDNDKGLPADIIVKSSNFQELQQGFPNIGVPGYTAEELQSMNSAIANYRKYSLQTKRIKPGYKMAFDAGQSFRSATGIKYGFTGTAYYSMSEKSKETISYSTHFDSDTRELTSGEKSNVYQTELNEKIGGILSLGIGIENHDLKYTFLHIDDSEDIATFNDTDGGPEGPGVDDEQRTFYEYVEKTISAHQLRGEHELSFSKINFDFFDNVKFSWALEKAEATRLVPGSVEYFYEKTSDTTDYTLDKKIWYQYSDLIDELDNYRFDFKLPYKNNTKDNHTSFGAFIYNKSRTLDNRRFKTEHKLGTDVFQDIDEVFTQENVDNEDLVLTSNYRADDAYTAKQDVLAFYVNQLYSATKKLDVLAGIRQETSKQELIDSKTGEPFDPLETSDSLISLGINYNISDEHKIRFGYANTLTRPDFRDFSPNRSKHPVTEDIYNGNPDLTYTTIKNLDLKYEWYISHDEIFSVGLFVKDFTNPIETIVIPDTDSQSGKNKGKPVNALGALSKGFEISFRKKLGFFDKRLANFFVASNFALIDSKIEIDKNSDDEIVRSLTTSDRPMQEQSPYVLNLNIGYDNLNTGRSAILLFNQFGKRVIGLGVDGAPDFYEYPFAKLDFVVKWRLNDTYDEQVKKVGYNLDFKVSNILDSTEKTKQGDALDELYKPGRTFTLSFSMKY